MKLNDDWYQAIKWLVLIFLPALNTLIFVIGGELGYDLSTLNNILTAVSAFLGTVVGVSTLDYYRKEEQNGNSNGRR
ncbi:phage holin [Streptococcus danieliae]|uniref:Holin n=1 Tax=Streptococcus danieliae TaxID=747656 RepID=A0A7Z0M6S5_9STRE|nr:phage holin [Streptococcus danieliae]MBF0699686.1 holin [Streptococcus danieliae]NYS96862.1 holin [Streptococcus danieliae]